MKIELINIDVANQGHITNTYLLYDEYEGNIEGILIDPADNAKKIIKKIKEKNIKIKYIIVTHAHADHIGALEKVEQFTKAKIMIHKNDKEALLGIKENYSEMLNVEYQRIEESDLLCVEDGYEFNILNMKFEIIHTPGHTAGCICIYEKTTNSLFTGDTLFYDCYGRCDLYSGDFNQMVKSLTKVFTRFNDVLIYPGHDRSVNISSAKKRIRLLLSLKGVKI